MKGQPAKQENQWGALQQQDWMLMVRCVLNNSTSITSALQQQQQQQQQRSQKQGFKLGIQIRLEKLKPAISQSNPFELKY
eukprot:974220-Pelagomonas_calceolata.AAC.1